MLDYSRSTKLMFVLFCFMFITHLNAQTYTVFVKAHILTDNNGNNAACTAAFVSSAITSADGFFDDVDIELIDTDYFQSTTYLNLISDEVEGLFATFDEPGVIHVIFVNTFVGYNGWADGYGGNKLIYDCDASIVGEIIAHEFGHCFNLKHTYADGGDDVSDTPVDLIDDPGDLTQGKYFILGSCSYVSGSQMAINDPYGVLITNLMAHAKYPECSRYTLTTGQRNRITSHLSNNVGVIANMVKVNVENSFDGGVVEVDSDERESPYILSAAASSSHTLEAIEQNFESYYRLFDDWQDLDGGDLTYNTTKSISASSSGETSYRANFSKKYDVTFSLNSSNSSVVNEIELDDSNYTTPTNSFYVKETEDVEAVAKLMFHDDSPTAEIYYYFDHWENSSTNNTRTEIPDDHESYTAYYKGYGYAPGMHFEGSTGQPIIVDWDEHPNSAVTQYQVWRKDPINTSGAPIGTVNRGTTSYTDMDYVHDDNDGDYSKLFYAVIAYYSTDGTWSGKSYNSVLGDIGRQIKSTDDESYSANATTEIEESQLEYSISNSPNPFNPTTRISFSIPEAEHVTIKVFNMLGKEVATLVNEVRSAGNHEVNFYASNYSSGVYIYTIQTPNFAASKKMILMK